MPPTTAPPGGTPGTAGPPPTGAALREKILASRTTSGLLGASRAAHRAPGGLPLPSDFRKTVAT